MLKLAKSLVLLLVSMVVCKADDSALIQARAAQQHPTPASYIKGLSPSIVPPSRGVGSDDPSAPPVVQRLLRASDSCGPDTWGPPASGRSCNSLGFVQRLVRI